MPENYWTELNFETVDALMRHEGDVEATAEELDITPNLLYGRLMQIRKVASKSQNTLNQMLVWRKDSKIRKLLTS